MPDHAIVVGVSGYFGLPRLEGPDNDALRIREWLVDPEGGNLDKANAKLIRTKDFDPPATGPDDAQPEKRAIEKAFRALIREGGRQSPIGDCLYVYMAGHGFAPALEEGAIFTADFDLTARDAAHFYTSAWLDWFRQARYFQRYVLWMDCCVEPQRVYFPDAPRIPRVIGQGKVPPVFIAMAAQTGQALEREFEGELHGAFTWTLLQGLRGAARDAQGQVTGRSLRRYLLNALKDNLPEEVRRAQAVDVTPFVPPVIDEDPFVFGRPAAAAHFNVTLRLSGAAEGSALRIWGNRAPFTEVAQGQVAGGGWQGDLPRGLYVAEVIGAGRHQGFEVTGSGPVDLTLAHDGPPVDAAAAGTEGFELEIATHEAATITLIDPSFKRLLTSTGNVVTHQPPGLYKIRGQFGRGVGAAVDRVLLLDGNRSIRVDEQPVRSAAPIPGTALTHEHHVAAYASLAHGRTLADGQARLSLIARYWTPDGTPPIANPPYPFAGLRLVTWRGRPTAGDLMEGVAYVPGPDPIAPVQLDLRPGYYGLRHTLTGGRVFEQALVAVAGWDTRLFIRREASDLAAREGETAPFARLGHVTTLMRRPGEAFAEQDQLVEVARIALAQGRNILAEERGPEDLERLLFGKWQDPITGIIGGHLLCRAIDEAGAKASERQRTKLDTVVRNLRELLGDEHPDVEALSLRCIDPALRTRKPFAMPPMLHASWQLIVERSRKDPTILDTALYRRIHALAVLPPFLFWASDEGTRRAHARRLRAWIRREVKAEAKSPPAVPAPGTDVTGVMASLSLQAPAPPSHSGGLLPESVYTRAVGLGIPASVLEDLWSSAAGGGGG